MREGNLYVVYSNESVSWVRKVRVLTLDRLEKEDFSVSDTGDPDEKIQVLPIGVEPPWGGGELSYKSDEDARRLALGCKLQILISRWVIGMESHYIGPFRYRLVLCIKKFTKNALTLTTQKSPLGVSLSLSHTHIGLAWGFRANLSGPPLNSSKVFSDPAFWVLSYN